jgi:hypothetical protein
LITRLARALSKNPILKADIYRLSDLAAASTLLRNRGEVVMSSQLAKRPHVPAPSTKANARALEKLVDSRRALVPVRVDAASERRTKSPSNNPLWVIAIAMAVFFGATALIMMV